MGDETTKDFSSLTVEASSMLKAVSQSKEIESDLKI
jgi:hypothetical protein